MMCHDDSTPDHRTFWTPNRTRVVNIQTRDLNFTGAPNSIKTAHLSTMKARPSVYVIITLDLVR